MRNSVKYMKPDWKIEKGLVDYQTALELMEARVAAIREGQAEELVWLLEHPPLYTAGTSADAGDLIDPDRFPVFQTGRGGQYTYHGPGQRVGYVMLDLKARRPDVRAYVRGLEEWLIQTLAVFDVKGERREGRVGIWVVGDDGREDKVAALGVRIRKWVSFHGVALNVDPNLDHFGGIVPCGISKHGVTSLAKLGIETTMAEVDRALQGTFKKVF